MTSKLSAHYQHIADNSRNTSIEIRPILNHAAQLMAEEEADIPMDKQYELMAMFPVETIFVLAQLAIDYSELKCSLVNCLDLKSVVASNIKLTDEKSLNLFKLGIISALSLTSCPSVAMVENQTVVSVTKFKE